jgi:hypothetical protein
VIESYALANQRRHDVLTGDKGVIDEQLIVGDISLKLFVLLHLNLYHIFRHDRFLDGSGV